MTDAAVSRPAPQPRPAAGLSARHPNPNLRLVTVGDAESCSAATEGTTQARESRGLRGLRLHPAITDSAQWAAWVKSGLVYFTPPDVFKTPPATLAELAEYAYHAPWTRQQYIATPYTDETTKQVVKTGLIRSAGIWWYRLVGYPKTVSNRYSEWLWQRPGRILPVLALVKLIASTTWGGWAVDHILTPTAHFITWALL